MLIFIIVLCMPPHWIRKHRTNMDKVNKIVFLLHSVMKQNQTYYIIKIDSITIINTNCISNKFRQPEHLWVVFYSFVSEIYATTKLYPSIQLVTNGGIIIIHCRLNRRLHVHCIQLSLFDSWLEVIINQAILHSIGLIYRDGFVYRRSVIYEGN